MCGLVLVCCLLPVRDDRRRETEYKPLVYKQVDRVIWLLNLILKNLGLVFYMSCFVYFMFFSNLLLCFYCVNILGKIWPFFTDNLRSTVLADMMWEGPGGENRIFSMHLARTLSRKWSFLVNFRWGVCGGEAGMVDYNGGIFGEGEWESQSWLL